MKLKPLVLLSALILGVGALFRLSYLNSLPVFADEAIYVRWAQVMQAEPSLRFLPLSDGKQPFYMWALIPVLKIIADPLIAGRALSALGALGTITGVGLLAFLLFNNKRIGLLAAALWAVLPYPVFFERMALVDALLVLFTVWYVVCILVSIAHQRLDMALIAGFFAGFAWLTKSPAVFALGLLPSLSVFLPKYNRRNIITACGLGFAAGLIAFGMYNILRLGPEFHMIALRNKDYVYPLSRFLNKPLDPLIPHLKDTYSFYLYFITPVGLLLAIWGLFAERKSHLRERLILGLWWLVPVFTQSVIAKTFTARYLLFTAPFACLLVAHALSHIGDRTPRHRLLIAGLALVVIPSLYLDVLYLFRPSDAPLPRIERAGYLEEWTAGTGLASVSSVIRSQAASGPVVVGSEGFFGTPFDALGMYLNDVRNVRVVGVGVWIDSVHEKLISALDENKVFLVVNSSRFHGRPEDLGLKLIGSYPKADPPDRELEFLLFFEVLPRK